MAIVSAAALFAAALIGARFSSWPSSSKSGTDGSIQTLAVSDSVGASGTIAIPGHDRIFMKAGQKVQEVDLGNPKQNDCYMTIAILLPDRTRLYKSGMLKPGQALTSIEISRELKAGTYKGAILSYSCYSTEGMQALNGAETIFNLELPV